MSAAPKPVHPVALHEHAADNLRFIRQTMERAGSFTAVPGWGGFAMGCIAVAAGLLAAEYPVGPAWLEIWVAAAGLAFAAGAFAMWRKARAAETPLSAAPIRRFALGFAPSIVAASLLTAGLARRGDFSLLPAVWLLSYGAGVISGGVFSIRIIPEMGAVFLVLGAAAAFQPAWGHNLLIAGFGLLQMIVGGVIARRHGG